MRKQLVGVLLLALFGLSLIVGLFLIFQPREELPRPEFAALAGLGKEAIGIVRIHGVISTQRPAGLFGLRERGADYYVQRIRRLSENPRVKAIVLRVNSPGGSVGACQEIYDEILRARENGKKVIVSMGDLAASGGYYISAGADYILANPGTITGGIGVAIGNINFHELMDRWGVKMDIIKSGKYKDTLSSWREMTEEEREHLQKLVDRVHLQFINAVAEGREMDLAEVKAIADGRVFTGEEALELGLVDRLGGFQSAIEVAAEKAGIKGKPALIDEERWPWERFLSPGSSGKEDAISKLLGQSEDSYLPVQYIYHPPSL
ncbi:signal peptide peptidase SppA [candidate division NPL-UPA2 bacterium]|nr:signal peptide peptidase SppA [candidate division NPL-UPA2 bacterium]